MAGDVVQINPDLAATENNLMFAGCFMVVQEIRTWGVQGYVLIPRDRKTWPGAAYYRAKWDQIKLVGASWWVFKNDSTTDRDDKQPLRSLNVDVPPVV